MSSSDKISRKKFIYQAGLLGAAASLTPLVSSAKNSVQQKKIKVAIIGCGSVSTQYLPHLSKSPYVELVSTCDIIPERAVNAAKKYSIPNNFPSIEKLLAGPAFDLMVNLTNMQEHGRLNKLAINAGKNVWSEKPMATTYQEGKELLELAKKKGVRIWGAPAVVMSPQFAFMAKAINEGKLGKVSAAHAHYGHLGPDWSAFFYEKNGGSMPDLGVYNMVTLTGLLGPVKSVVAMLNIITPERKVSNRPNPIKVEEEDNSMVLMEHASGALSHVQSGFNYFDPYGHAGKGQDKPTVSIWGTEGNLQLIGYDWAPFGVDMATKDNEATQRMATDTGTYVWQQGASAICEAMATGKEPIITAPHALHVLEIIEAARQSQATGRRITLQSTFNYPVIS
ncbi:Gfo/Idh/MocA family protein [Chryseolinea soli]|uniref:Gfo/Idh/MocA family protein n=1 Tax=Chryseolinea soli TaxID=2321403 RepID=UPI0015755395|nr:Gfo/Idh/MocA family oxidoreductase [Chryseolinea soli]